MKIVKAQLPTFVAVLIFGFGLFFALLLFVSIYFVIASLPENPENLSLSSWSIWWQLIFPTFCLITLATIIVYRLLSRSLIQPVQKLARNMSRLVDSQYEDQSIGPVELTAGLGQLRYSFIELKKMMKRSSTTGLNHVISDSKRTGRKEDGSNTDISGFNLIQSLRLALDNNELSLVFQPVVDLQGHRTVYLEALLRWKDPKMHGVSIERTIQLAEKSQLIQPLTDWIIVTVCKLLKEQNIEDLAIGINLSMIDLHDRNLPKRMEKYLKKYQIKPGQVLVEITEGQIMQDPDEVADILSHLGVMGLSLSVDDFGTGQASLTYLKKLPVEKLKIDQSFISDMVNNEDDRLIVKATIELAHTLDLKVIAEGVETAEAHDLLKEMNCDYVQGYYISHPLEADQIEGWYKQLEIH